MSQAAAVTSASFDKEVLQSELPVLVDFWAEWCRPCLRIAPEIDAVAEQMAGKATIRKVDVSAEPDLAGKYGIQNIPALFIFKGGKVVEQMSGVMSRQSIAAKLLQYV